ncbi:g1201 [Coccomyxa viridis]|uniref:G1201 protein n=1 Tax=Coccomyxa viridis TaxID=1274662 RepID=A0ABP1FLB5_9CHLO
MIYSRTALLQICVRSGIPKHRLHTKACNSSAETAVVLKRIQKAVRVPLPSSTTHTELCIQGHGTYMGMECQWNSRFRPMDGAFLETIESSQLSFTYGHTGCSARGRLSQSWAVEQDGLPKEYSLDDHEALMLTSWVRNGFFLEPLAQHHLCIQHVRYSEDQGLRLDGQHAAGGTQPSTGEAVVLRLRLQTGRLEAFLLVCAQTWQPQRMCLKVCGQPELVSYQDWAQWEIAHTSVICPSHLTMDGGANGHNIFNTDSVSWVTSPAQAAYLMPPCPVRPIDTSFCASHPGTAPAWWTAGGHVLVKPSINACADMGYFILDTGASGCVIEKDAADALELERFGDIAVSGMAGRIQSCFRRAASIQLGPVTMTGCLFMEMGIGGLIRGAPGPVIGIVGHDIFRRCILTLPPPPAGGAPSKEVQLLMQDPAQRHPKDDLLQWQEVEMVSNLPHVPVRLRPSDAEGSQREALLMVDLGASGSEVIFHSRAVEELGLQDLPQARTTQLKGVGGVHAKSVMMYSSRIPGMEMCGATYTGVNCLLTRSTGGPDFSCYTHGTLCADMLARCTTVFDYASKRMACIQA